MTGLDRIKQLIKAFDDAREHHAKTGADDTEPRDLGYDRIVRAITPGKLLKTVPMSADKWQLYSTDEDDPDPNVTPEKCEAAAADLYATCQAVVDYLVNELPNLPHREAVQIEEYVREWCS